MQEALSPAGEVAGIRMVRNGQRNGSIAPRGHETGSLFQGGCKAGRRLVGSMVGRSKGVLAAFRLPIVEHSSERFVDFTCPEDAAKAWLCRFARVAAQLLMLVRVQGLRFFSCEVERQFPAIFKADLSRNARQNIAARLSTRFKASTVWETGSTWTWSRSFGAASFVLYVIN